MAKTIICHCEDVTVEELRSAIEQGYSDIETIKRYTGIGTGKCQGKCCLVQLIRFLHEESGELPENFPTIRPPVLPLRIEEIVEAGTEEKHGQDG